MKLFSFAGAPNPRRALIFAAEKNPQLDVADISALCMIDFTAAIVDLKPDDSLSHLWAWHDRVSRRSSIHHS